MFDNVWWWPVPKKLVSSSLCTLDVSSNVFLPRWNSNVYQEPLNRWEIFKELSTDSMSMKCILLKRSITYQFFNIFWKHRSPRNGVMDRTMSFSPWTKPRWTTQMNYPSNYTNPSMFFRFVFVSHNEQHEI